jgi:hypothetical protein
MSSRRVFIRLAALSSIGVLGVGEAIAADAPVLGQNDPQAIALGYVCPLYGGKQVAAKGWCSAYARKTG